MNTQKRIAFAMMVSWASKGLSILAALFLIPTLFRYMSKEELGIWYLLGNSQAFLGLLGFGVAPVLTRHIAFLAKSSAVEPDAKLKEHEIAELSDLLHTGRTVLRWMALGTLVVVWVCGYFLIRKVPLHSVSWTTVFWAWTLMCIGWALGVWMSYLDCWVAGLGYVGWDTMISMTLSSLTICAYIVAVLWGGGLLALAWIALASVLIQRAILIAFLKRRNADVFSLHGKWSPVIARRLVRPSMNLWVMSIGAFLLYKTDQYFIALYRGVSEVALYQSTYNTVFALAIISQAYINASSVFVSQYWAQDDLPTIHRLLVKGCRVGFVMMVSGAMFLLFTGKEFFQLWLSGSFIGYPVLIILVISLALDMQHGLLTSVSRATDDEKYAIPATVAGVLNLGLTWYLIRRIGLVGVPLGTLIAQVLTNNWYGVYRPLFRLQFPFLRYLRQVIFPVALFGGATVLVLLAIKPVLARTVGYSPLVFCGAVMLVCAIAGIVGMLLVFHPPTQSYPYRFVRAYAEKIGKA